MLVPLVKKKNQQKSLVKSIQYKGIVWRLHRNYPALLDEKKIFGFIKYYKSNCINCPFDIIIYY